MKTRKKPNSPGSPDSPLDVAIVGGGPGGLYSAWRIASAPVDEYCSIAVFEATSRVGGRVRTLPRELTGFTADIGAMRFLRHQLIINALMSKFFSESSVYQHDVPVASYFLRGHHLIPPLNPEQCRNARKSGHSVPKVRKQLGELTPKGSVRPQTLFRSTARVCAESPSHILVHGLARALAKVSIERRKGVDDHQASKLERVLGKLSKVDARSLAKVLAPLRPEDWRLIQEHGVLGGRHLYMQTLWEILRTELSQEDFALGQEALGYHTIFGAWNAAEHIPWFLSEFGDVKYSSVIGGMSQLTDKLETLFVERINNRRDRLGLDKMEVSQLVRRQMMLVRINKHGTEKRPLYELQFKPTRELPVPECYDFDPADDGPSLNSVWARQIIISVSKGALQRIEFGAGFELKDGLRRLVGDPATTRFALAPVLKSVESNPLMKAFLLYKTPWYWERLHASHKAEMGRSNRATIDDGRFVSSKILTDTPIRQLYFHGPNGPWWNVQQAADKRPEVGYGIRGMIMAYCDARESEYWSLLSNFRGPGQQSQHYASIDYHRWCSASGSELPKLLDDVGVSEQFQTVFHNHITKAFGAQVLKDGEDAVENPEVIYFMDWRRAPYYGGWHAWNITYRPWEIRKAAWSPFSGERVFVCGEAMSADQGWIEGALRTAERVLLDRGGLNLPIPEWKELVDSMGTQGGQWMTESEGAAGAGTTNVSAVERAFRRYVAW